MGQLPSIDLDGSPIGIIHRFVAPFQVFSAMPERPRSSISRRWAPLLVLVGSVIAGCGATADPESGPTAGPRLNVVWILLDALRADHLSAYRYDRPTSPNIDALAHRGTLFESNWAQAPNTLYSVPSYMTGRLEPTFYQDPGNLDIWFLRRPPAEEQLVSTVFRENGYETAMFSASPWFSSKSRLARSFDTFAPLAHEEGTDPRRRSANAALFEWLEARGERPFFLYVHALDTHEPRFSSNTDPRWLDDRFPAERDGELRRRWNAASPPFDEADRAHIEGLYDGGVLVADGFVGEIVAAVDALGIRDRTVFVVSSDHGEALAEDGQTLGHPSTASHDEILRVPLILSGAPFPSGHRVTAMSQNADIVPTIVQALGLETGAVFQGASLVPSLESPEGPIHDYAYARTERYLAFSQPHRVLVFPDRKYEVRERSASKGGGFTVDAYLTPDPVRERTRAPRDPAREEAIVEEVRSVLVPLRQLVESQPEIAPPVFEVHHRLFYFKQHVVRDRLDPADGKWTQQITSIGRGLRVHGKPFARERFLVGFPATEELVELQLDIRMPNGAYRASISSAALYEDTPASFRFRAATEDSFRELVVQPMEGKATGERWIELGRYEVTDSRFRYSLAAGTRGWPAVIGRLRFQVEGHEDSRLATDEEWEAEQERLRSLGYLE